jgi:phospholipid/cholesterol/gamma-HCH transport system permease protein
MPDSSPEKAPAPNKLKQPIERLGQSTIGVIEELGNMALLLGQTFIWAVRPPYRVKVFFQALESVGVGSLFIVLFTGTFTGLVMAYQSIYAFSLFNAQTLVGGTVAASVVRELGPVLTGLMVAGRTGSSMTTELGTMRVTEQIDAMAVMAVNPVQYLVMPRVLATMLMMPMLAMLFNVVAIAAAYTLSVKGLDIDPGIFVQKIRDFLEVRDIINCGIKAACFGLAIGLVGCYKGFYASGGAKGVGEATTSSVVTSSIAILLIDYVLTVFMY